MNFSFPFLPADPERLPLARCLPFVLLAFGVHAALVLGPSPQRQQPARASRLASPADDTPQLLRLSRAEEVPVPLSSGSFSALPPPPPALLPKGPLAPAATPELQAALPLPPLPSRLSDAAAAFRSLLRQPPGLVPAAGDRDTFVALQRRLWWLTAAQEPLVQALWQRATVIPSIPDGLGPLPDAAELRRWTAADLPGLGAGNWHGHGLLGRQGALLLWRQDGSVWLLRLPLPDPEPAAKTLTSS